MTAQVLRGYRLEYRGGRRCTSAETVISCKIPVCVTRTTSNQNLPRAWLSLSYTQNPSATKPGLPGKASNYLHTAF